MADGPIELRGVTVRYGRHLALDAISGSFPAGSLTAVVGANGAGKSTLLAVLAGIVRPTSGAVVMPARSRPAYLPQAAAIDSIYPLTTWELIALGGWRQFGAFRAPTPAMRAAVTAAAETVGLTQRLHDRAGALSLGQRQRALFARLIVQDARTILLDEPFAAVDAETAAVLLAQLHRWHHEGRTVVAVLHDIAMVRAHFPAALVLACRCLAWGPTDTALPALAA